MLFKTLETGSGKGSPNPKYKKDNYVYNHRRRLIKNRTIKFGNRRFRAQLSCAEGKLEKNKGTD